MSKFKTMVKKDIELCDEYINKNMATHSEVNALCITRKICNGLS